MDQARRIVALSRAANLLIASGDGELTEIGAAVVDWLRDGEGLSLEAALRIAAPQGGRSWRYLATIAARDDALREASARFGLSAGELAAALKTYHGRGWRRHKVATVCPSTIAGTLGEWLWRALRAREHVLTARHVRDVLAAGGNKQPGLISEPNCYTDSTKGDSDASCRSVRS